MPDRRVVLKAVGPRVEAVFLAEDADRQDKG